jgi:hypothetical protein
MALDLSKMKAKLDKLANNGKENGSNSVKWKMEEGQHSVRIVPTEDGDPFKELFFHYGVGGKTVLCPKKNFSDSCPICDFASQLWREGTANEDKESQKMAKQLFPKQRFMSPVIVRGEEAKGVQVWEYGKRAYETMIGLVLNPEYGDITDTEEGLDLVIDYTKPPAGAKDQFPETKITPRRKSSPLCDPSYGGPAKCKELLDSIPDFDALYPRQSTAEVQKILDASFSTDESAESSSREIVKGGSTKSKGKTSSVDEAFEDFNSK